MSDLQTLEEIAAQLGSMLDQNNSIPSTSHELAGRTTEELMSELGRLSIGINESRGYFDYELTDVYHTLSNKPTDLAFSSKTLKPKFDS